MFNLKDLYKKNWKIKVHKKIDLLILDDSYVDFDFKNIKCHLLYNELYLFEAIQSIFIYLLKKTQLNLYEVYFSLIVNNLNPKIAIGHDKNGKIFLFKKLFPSKISIAYQFGYIFDFAIADQYKKKLQNKNVDYYFVYDKRSKKILEKIIKSKFMISGSLKANELIDNSSKKQIYDITFISNFRPIKKNHNHPKLTKYQNQHDTFLIEIISNYCKRNKLKFCVALSSSRKDKIQHNYYLDEIQFLKKLSSNFITEKNNSYELAKKTNLCIGSFSNLAYELLLGKKKVNVFYKEKKNKIQFPRTLNSNFVLYSKNKNIIEDRIEKLLSYNQKNWEKLNKNFYNNAVYDKKNNILKKLIKSNLK